MKKPIKFNLFIKAISLGLILCFLGEQVLFADPDLRPFSQGLFQEERLRLNFEIPESVATVENSWKGGQGLSNKTIYLLQDAHTNNSGQINSAKALDIILQHEKDIRLIFSEAGVGDSSLSFLRKYQTLGKRKQIAASYLNRGLLHGAEYLDLTSNHKFTLWGVEDPELYIKSVQTYGFVAQKRDKFEDYLNKVEQTTKTLKTRIYNPILLSFDETYQKYQTQEISLTDYFEDLTNQAKALEISIQSYPHLKLLKELISLESRIDFKKATEEQERAIDSLPTTDKEELYLSKDMNKSPLRFSKEEHRAVKGFYALLEEKLVTGKSKCPELSKYFRYLKKAQQINLLSILREQKDLEKEVFSKLCTNQDEITLVAVSKDLELLKKLFNLTLTPDEFKEYQEDKQSFDIKRITGFLNKKIMDLKKDYERAVFLESGYEDVIQKCEEFYTLTYDRDMQFIQNMTQKMDETRQTKSILITGGYHTPNLKYLLKEKGVSYVVITPQILHETNIKRYEKILLSQDITRVDALQEISPSHQPVSSMNMTALVMSPYPPAGARLVIQEISGQIISKIPNPRDRASNESAGARTANQQPVNEENSVHLEAFDAFAQEFTGPIYYPASGYDFAYTLKYLAKMFPRLNNLVMSDSDYLRYPKIDGVMITMLAERVRHEIASQFYSRDLSASSVDIISDDRLEIKLSFGPNASGYLKDRSFTIRYEAKDLYQSEDRFDVVYLGAPPNDVTLDYNPHFWEKMHGQARRYLLLGPETRHFFRIRTDARRYFTHIVDKETTYDELDILNEPVGIYNPAKSGSGARLSLAEDLSRFGIHVNGNEIDFSKVPQNVHWVMDDIRPAEQGPVFEKIEDMPVAESLHSFQDMPDLSKGISGRKYTFSNEGILLGAVKSGQDSHPAVIKMFPKNFGERRALAELINAQIRDRVGVAPRFYGILKDTNGKVVGYAMQLVIQHDKYRDRNQPFDQDALEKQIRRRFYVLSSSMVFLPEEYMETRINRLVAIDAGINERDMEEFFRNIGEVIKKINAGARMAENSETLTPPKLVQIVPAHERHINGLIVNSQSRELISHAWTTIKRWQVEPSGELRFLKEISLEGVHDVLSSPISNRMAVQRFLLNQGSHQVVGLVDTKSGEIIKEVTGYSADFSKDGKKLAVSSDGKVLILDALTGEEKLVLKTDHMTGREAVFSNDLEGTKIVVTGNGDNFVLVFDSRNGQLISRLNTAREVHDGEGIYFATFLKDDKTVVTGGGIGHVGLWDSLSGKPEGELVRGHQGMGFSVDDAIPLSDGKRLLTFSYRGSGALWNVQDRRLIHKLDGGPYRFERVRTLSPDESLLATSVTDESSNPYKQELWVWDIATDKVVFRFNGLSAAFLSNDRIAVGTNEGTIQVWELSKPVLSISDTSEVALRDPRELTLSSVNIDISSNGVFPFKGLPIILIEEESREVISKYVKLLTDKKLTSHHFVFAPNQRALNRAHALALRHGRLAFVVANGQLKGIVTAVQMGGEYSVIYKHPDDRYNSPGEVVDLIAGRLEPEVIDKDGNPIMRFHREEPKAPELPPLSLAMNTEEGVKGARMAEIDDLEKLKKWNWVDVARLIRVSGRIEFDAQNHAWVYGNTQMLELIQGMVVGTWSMTRSDNFKLGWVRYLIQPDQKRIEIERKYGVYEDVDLHGTTDSIRMLLLARVEELKSADAAGARAAENLPVLFQQLDIVGTLDRHATFNLLLSIGRSGDQRFIRPLLTLVQTQHEDPEVRGRALDTLRHLILRANRHDPEIASPTLDRIRDTIPGADRRDNWTRVEALDIVAGILSEKGLDEYVRSEAIALLPHLVQKDDRQSAERVARLAIESFDAAPQQSAEALAALGIRRIKTGYPTSEIDLVEGLRQKLLAAPDKLEYFAGIHMINAMASLGKDDPAGLRAILTELLQEPGLQKFKDAIDHALADLSATQVDRKVLPPASEGSIGTRAADSTTQIFKRHRAMLREITTGLRTFQFSKSERGSAVRGHLQSAADALEDISRMDGETPSNIRDASWMVDWAISELALALKGLRQYSRRKAAGSYMSGSDVVIRNIRAWHPSLKALKGELRERSGARMAKQDLGLDRLLTKFKRAAQLREKRLREKQRTVHGTRPRFDRRDGYEIVDHQRVNAIVREIREGWDDIWVDMLGDYFVFPEEAAFYSRQKFHEWTGLPVFEPRARKGKYPDKFRPKGARMSEANYLYTPNGEFVPDGRPIIIFADDHEFTLQRVFEALGEYYPGYQFVATGTVVAMARAIKIANQSGHLKLVITDNGYPLVPKDIPAENLTPEERRILDSLAEYKKYDYEGHGLYLIHYLKDEGLSVPIILYSGHGIEPSSTQLKNIGYPHSQYVTKNRDNLNVDELTAQVRQLIGARLAVIEELAKYGIKVAGEKFDFSSIPQNVEWVMDELRPVEYKPIAETLETMPVAKLKYAFHEYPSLPGKSTHSSGMFLGIGEINGKEQPIVIKLFLGTLFADRMILAELVNAQFYDRLGIGPRFYGVLKNEQGQVIGYVMQLVIGRSFDRNSLADNIDDHPDMQEIIDRSEGLLSTPKEVMETRKNRIVAIDAGISKFYLDEFYERTLRLREKLNGQGARMVATIKSTREVYAKNLHIRTLKINQNVSSPDASFRKIMVWGQRRFNQSEGGAAVSEQELPRPGYVRLVSDELLQKQAALVRTKLPFIFADGITYRRTRLVPGGVESPLHVDRAYEKKEKGTQWLHEIILTDLTPPAVQGFKAEYSKRIGRIIDSDFLDSIQRQAVLHEVGEILYAHLPEEYRQRFAALVQNDKFIQSELRRKDYKQAEHPLAQIFGSNPVHEVFADYFGLYIDPDSWLRQYEPLTQETQSYFDNVIEYFKNHHTQYGNAFFVPSGARMASIKQHQTNINQVDTIYYWAAGRDFETVEFIRNLFPNATRLHLEDAGYNYHLFGGLMPSQWPGPAKVKDLYNAVKARFELKEERLDGFTAYDRNRNQMLEIVLDGDYVSRFKPDESEKPSVYIIRNPDDSANLSRFAPFYAKLVRDMRVGDYVFISEAFLRLDVLDDKRSGLKKVPNSVFELPNAKIDHGAFVLNRNEEGLPLVREGWVIYQKSKPEDRGFIESIEKQGPIDSPLDIISLDFGVSPSRPQKTKDGARFAKNALLDSFAERVSRSAFTTIALEDQFIAVSLDSNEPSILRFSLLAPNSPIIGVYVGNSPNPISIINIKERIGDKTVTISQADLIQSLRDYDGKFNKALPLGFQTTPIEAWVHLDSYKNLPTKELRHAVLTAELSNLISRHVNYSAVHLVGSEALQNEASLVISKLRNKESLFVLDSEVRYPDINQVHILTKQYFLDNKETLLKFHNPRFVTMDDITYDQDKRTLDLVMFNPVLSLVEMVGVIGTLSKDDVMFQEAYGFFKELTGFNLTEDEFLGLIQGDTALVQRFALPPALRAIDVDLAIRVWSMVARMALQAA